MWPDGFDLSALGESGNTDAPRRTLLYVEQPTEVDPFPRFNEDSVTADMREELYSILRNMKNILGED